MTTKQTLTPQEISVIVDGLNPLIGNKWNYWQNCRMGKECTPVYKLVR